MALFSRLFGGKSENEPAAHFRGPGTYAVDIVGESAYQSTLEEICGGRTDESQQKIIVATLVHEDNNPYDNKAVRIDIGGKTVGHLSRRNAREYRKQMRKAGYPGRITTCSAMIVGGWDRGARGRGHFGVKLDLPASE
jgi:hypothetical protein